MEKALGLKKFNVPLFLLSKEICFVEINLIISEST